jgi:hypothetical protein
MPAVNKRRILLKSIITFILLFTFNSCDLIYSPDTEHFVNVAKPNTPMSIDLSSAGDTIIATGEINFNFIANTNGKVFSQIRIIIDSSYFDSWDDRSAYDFNSEYIADGMHKLRLEVWAYSGSGSLADRLKSEFLVGAKEWYLLVDNHTFAGKFVVDTAYCENGSVTIKWEKYPYNDFAGYEFYRAKCDTNGNPIYFYLQSTISDRNINSFRDTTYCGGPVEYQVRVFAKNKSYYSPAKSFNDVVGSVLSITQLDDQTVRIVCSKIKYYNNVDRYYLMGSYYTNSTYLVGEYTPQSDTVFTDKPGFGATVSYYLQFLDNNYYADKSASKSFYLGTRIQPFNTMQFVPQSNSLYFNFTGYTERWDALNMVSLARGNGKIVVSSAGSYAFGNDVNLSGELYPHSFTQVNPLTLQKAGNTIYTDSYLGYYSTNEAFTVSETGLIPYVGYKYASSYYLNFGGVFLFNPAAPAVIAKDTTAYADETGAINISKPSDEGEYFIPPGCYILYNINGGAMKRIGQLAYSNSCFSQTGKEFIFDEYLGISVYKCKDLSLIRKFPVSDDVYYPVIDPVTGYLGGYIFTSNKFRIYDINSGALIKEIQLPKNDLSARYYLYNSTLFSNRGYYIKVAFSKKRGIN